MPTTSGSLGLLALEASKYVSLGPRECAPISHTPKDLEDSSVFHPFVVVMCLYVCCMCICLFVCFFDFVVFAVVFDDLGFGQALIAGFV